MLRVVELRVSYGAVAAVRGVDLDVDAGEIVAITGPNGSGKSSFLAAVAGLVPAGGEVWLGDERLDGRAAEARARAGVALVPEGHRPFRRLTVTQNLLVGTIPLPRRRVAAAVARILDAFPLLADRAEQRGATLSGGEGQLLLIARALIASPRVLLVDEPFQGLDEAASRLVRDALDHAAAAGSALVIASPHAVDGARTVAMAHGSIGVPA